MSVHLGGPRLGLLLLAAVTASCGAGTNTMTDAAQVSPTATAPNEWTMYGQGPGRTNFNPGETTLSAATLPRLSPAWEFDVGTSGDPTASAPVVAGGRVYVGSSVSIGDNYFALDAGTGQLVWSADLGHGSDNSTNPCGSVGLGSTAAVASGVVVVGGGDSAYYALDAATGAVLWRHALGLDPYGFAWSSPLVAGGRAYVGVASACVDPVRGELRALDVATGALVANQFFVPPEADGASVWNSATLSPDGTVVYVATGNDKGTHGAYEQAVVSLDAQTLAILQADKRGPTDLDLDFVSTPITFSDAGGRPLLGASHKTGVFYAYLASNLSAGPLWSRTVGAVIGLAPAYDPGVGNGGTLFFGGTDDQGRQQVRAVDPATGADRWPPVTLNKIHGNLAAANGLLFVNAGTPGLHVFDERTGALLRVLVPSAPGRSYSGVAVAQGTVYWLSGSVLNAWRLPI